MFEAVLEVLGEVLVDLLEVAIFSAIWAGLRALGWRGCVLVVGVITGVVLVVRYL